MEHKDKEIKNNKEEGSEDPQKEVGNRANNVQHHLCARTFACNHNGHLCAPLNLKRLSPKTWEIKCMARIGGLLFNNW